MCKWSGNSAAVAGKPCIFDPAVYYGHHEAEWGMSWCASFPPAFWKAYRELIPKDPGFEERADLYELYHQLATGVNFYGEGDMFAGGGLMDGLETIRTPIEAGGLPERKARRLSACDPCTAGYYQPATGQTSCDDGCLAGTYSDAGAASCIYFKHRPTSSTRFEQL